MIPRPAKMATDFMGGVIRQFCRRSYPSHPCLYPPFASVEVGVTLRTVGVVVEHVHGGNWIPEPPLRGRAAAQKRAIRRPWISFPTAPRRAGWGSRLPSA